jgi:hypothetical protein
MKRDSPLDRLVLSIDKIIDPIHVTHASQRIEDYRHAMLAGERFPPIAVVLFCGRYLVTDGHKRLSAYRALGVSEIEVEVWTKRRWLSDQFDQLRHKTGQQLRVIVRSPFDATARKQAHRLFWDTIGHWRRIVLSLRDHLKGRRPV